MYDLAYIQELINNQEQENIHMEYKAAAALARIEAKMAEISKDISAFANADGGILIYGITENPANRHLPGMIDPVDRSAISKEWLEQVINNRIRPRIQGLLIHPVELPAEPGKLLFVVEIPKGETAHQADDKRYYRRYNFLSEPMFDHEVRDVMNRVKTPQIQLEFEIRRAKKNIPVVTGAELAADGTLKYVFTYTLHIHTKNKGRIYARYINVIFDFPLSCLHPQPYDRFNQQRKEVIGHNKVRDKVRSDDGPYQRPTMDAPEYGPARYEPLLPGMKNQLIELRINEYATDAENYFAWTIYADNAEPEKSEMRFSDIVINT